MNQQYRFFLKIDDIRRQAYPIYGDDLSKNYSKESGQMFFRTKLDGKFKFVKADYDFIMSSAFDETIFVDIEMYDSTSKSWSNYFKGKFIRTDCTIIPDDLQLEVSLTPDDYYESLLSGMDKEFNLIELAPDIQEVSITKRPAIQIYITNTDVVTTFIGGTYFEQQSTGKYTNEDMERFHFSLQRKITYINVGISGSGKSGYEGHYYKMSDNTYINPEIRAKIVLSESDIRVYYDSAGDGSYSERVSSYERYVTDLDDLTYISFTAAGRYDGKTYRHSSSQINTGVEYGSIYARLVSDVESNSWPTYEIPYEDIVENNHNYKRCIGINVDSNIQISTQLSEQPTEWGIFQPGIYYVKPSNLYTRQFYPIGRSAWAAFSIWMTPFNLEYMYSQEAAKNYTLKHAYPYWSCVKALLSAVAPELVFDYSCSKFFCQNGNGYRDINPVSSIAFQVLLTQKTNILKGEYDQPAQKAMITLKQLLDMAKNCFQCYWYLDGNKLKIEHISYFNNGLRYLGWDGNAVVGKDLTQLKHPRSNKPWSYGTSEYSFEKEEMPAWYQFEWSDDVTFPFKGYQIEVLSNFVKKDNIETISVNKFVSDIDLMLLNPAAFSEDGFVVMVAVEDSSRGVYLPIVDKTIDLYEYHMQNGYAAFCDLQERYYIRSLPAPKVIINKTQRTVVPVRGKKQEVQFPVGNTDPSVYELIKTSLGNGQIKDMKINLSSRLAKVTLMHDTDKQ